MFEFNEQNVNIYLVSNDELLLKILEKRFADETEYNLMVFKTGEAFLHYFISNPIKKKSVIQITILDFEISSDKKNSKDGLEILKYIKNISDQMKVIVLTDQLNNVHNQKIARLGVSSSVKKNENSFIRIQNTIKWIISGRVIKEKKIVSKISFFIFIGLLSITLILGLVFKYLNTY